jgi:hypothetical protein
VISSCHDNNYISDQIAPWASKESLHAYAPQVNKWTSEMQNGPVPTQLTLLSDLEKFQQGSKVRFLGWWVQLLFTSFCLQLFPCVFANWVLLQTLSSYIHHVANWWSSVTHYSTKTAVLTLEHNFPTGNTLKVLVDIKLLVSTVKTNETQIGEWVNVMGYIQSQPRQNTTEFVRYVEIQAIVLWSSGPFNLERYEISLSERVWE